MLFRSADDKQLPRQRAGCHKRKENHSGKTWRKSGTYTLLPARTCGMLALLLFPDNRKDLCGTAATVLSGNAYNDYHKNGKDKQGKSSEHNSRRNLKEYADIRNYADFRTASVNRNPYRTTFEGRSNSIQNTFIPRSADVH